MRETEARQIAIGSVPQHPGHSFASAVRLMLKTGNIVVRELCSLSDPSS